MIQQINAWLDSPITSAERKLLLLVEKPWVKFVLTAIFLLGIWLYVNSWAVAGAVVAGIYIHEFGHLWAMRSVGLKTRGVWFIPFVGAIAFSKGHPGSRFDRFFIAAMGPLWGCGSALIPFLVFFYAFGLNEGDRPGNPAQAAFAIVFSKSMALVAMVNFVNLLPLPMLDGGRMMMEIIPSFGRKVSAVLALFFLASAGFVLWYLENAWLIALAVLGIPFLALEWRRRGKEIPMRGADVAIGLFFQLALLFALFRAYFAMLDQVRLWGGSL
jgi:Zn-dependent protease